MTKENALPAMGEMYLVIQHDYVNNVTTLGTICHSLEYANEYIRECEVAMEEGLLTDCVFYVSLLNVVD